MFKVAIVGKPNVGKSTLFNRLIGKRQAIVFDMPGTTRDRNIGICSWLNKEFELIDTGGFTLNKITSDNDFQYLINLQVNFAIAEADLILYVVSEKNVISNDDFLILKQLKKSKKPIILVANKAENTLNNSIYNNNWEKLGLGKPLYVSAEHGLNIHEIFSEIFKKISEDKNNISSEKITFCVIGKPNVGKSSLVNAILKQDKMMVSDIAGTTRDAIDSDFKFNGHEYKIIDTAGLRQRGKLDQIEKYALLRSEISLKRSQFVLLVIDIFNGITEQDKNVAKLIYDANMPCVIIANKIDLIQDFNKKTRNEWEEKIKLEFQFLPYAQIQFTSAKNNDVHLDELMKKILNINDELNRKIPTRLLMQVIDKAQVINPPPLFKGGKVELKSIEQVNGRMPTFVVKVNNVKYLHFSYMRFIENQIKQSFNFNLIPILVYYKDTKAKERN